MESNPGQSTPTPTPTPSSFPPAPDAHWQQWTPALLQKTMHQGMTALKKRQYEQAIALLEPILKHIQQPEATAQIQRALAKAYMAQRNIPEALRYCQSLQQHPDPVVQQWARNAIARLQQQHPQLATPPQLGAVAPSNGADNFERFPSTVPQSPVSSPSLPDATPPASLPTPPSQTPPAVAQPSPTPPSTRAAPPAATTAAASQSLADPGFKPLSPVPSPEAAPVSPLAELLSKLDRVPSDSPNSPSPGSPSPDSPPPGSTSPPSAPVGRDQLTSTQAPAITSEEIALRTTPKTDDPNQPLSPMPSEPLSDQIVHDPDSTLIQSGNTLIQGSSKRSEAAPLTVQDRPEQIETVSVPVQDFPKQSDTVSTSAQTPTVAIASLPWKQAERAKRWSPIPHKLTVVHRMQTLLTYTWTAISLWGVATVFLRLGMILGNPMREIISQMIRFERWYFLEYYPGRVAAMVLAGLILLAPLLLHFWLIWHHKTRRFTLDELGRYSPETPKLLQRSCKKHKHPLPRLRRIATQTPVLLSYGWRPRLAWIVVSDGLLRQLSDDEIAALYAAELSHVRQWSLGLITGFTVATQISYSFYQGFAQWGDRSKNAFLQWIGGAGAAIAYGMFWLVRNTGLWLARSRRRYSDRIAANLTGNPNGLVRGLLKFAIATATDIRRQGRTEPILEQFEWLMPVGYRSAISAGSIFPVQWQSPVKDGMERQSLEATILAWDYRNPYRDWMTVNNTHPPLGDRLYTLSRYAQHWRLEPELTLPSFPRIPDSGKMQRQMAPFFGIPIGAGISLLLWIIGLVANQFDWPIEWLRHEATSIFWGMIAMGFSFGTILRMNAFFPNIPVPTQTEPELARLLTQPNSLPIDSQPIHLKGKLLGRKGVDNWLNQDLILQTSTGMVRLHCISMLGTIGHLVFNIIRLTPLKGRTVTVTGWLRRGATPWIDVNTIRSQRGKPIQSGHPIWSTLLAGGLTLWGAYILYQTNL